MAKTKNKANLIKKTKRKDKTNSLGEREQHDGHVVSEFNLQQFGYFLNFFFRLDFYIIVTIIFGLFGMQKSTYKPIDFEKSCFFSENGGECYQIACLLPPMFEWMQYMFYLYQILNI